MDAGPDGTHPAAAVDEALLLRVGIDSGTGDAHGPLFADGTFEYVPIPERRDTAATRTYADRRARHGGWLGDHVPHLADAVPHHDPEFHTYTYGDVADLKCSQLARLTPGDLLLFYAGLKPPDAPTAGRPRLYVIGYFTVGAVRDLADCTPAERRQALDGHPNNAHVRLRGLTPESPGEDDRFPVIVRGDPTRSGLFRRARQLSDAAHEPLPDVAEAVGFDGALTRAGTARVLDADRADRILAYLDGRVG